MSDNITKKWKSKVAMVTDASPEPLTAVLRREDSHIRLEVFRLLHLERALLLG
jgi:hypothetical protein